MDALNVWIHKQLTGNFLLLDNYGSWLLSEVAMEIHERGPKLDEPKGDSLLLIVCKSVGIAMILTGAAWAATAIAFKYF